MEGVCVVGIAGVTNGGKTTLTNQLRQAFPHAASISMDDYFVPEGSSKLNRIKELNHDNWDEVAAIDFENLHADLDRWLSKQAACTDTTKPKPLLIIEGILIFNYLPLLPYYNKKYFLTIPKDECIKRRKLRVYDPPDPEGYFEHVVWPMYIKHYDEIKDQTDIVHIDGRMPKDEIFNDVHRQILAIIE